MLEQNLNELNIFALRDLARKTGVVSPTSKKKEELIREIIDILSGKKEPQQVKSKQGRPPKVFGYDFANVLSTNLTMDKTVETLSQQSLHQNIVKSEANDSVTIAGWIELANRNSALLWVEKNYRNENYFIPRELLNDINVKMGDRIVAEVSLDETSRVVKKIFSVNDCPITKLSKIRKDYSNVSYVVPSRKLQFNNQGYNSFELLKGENIFVYGADNNENTVIAIDMLNSCEIENKFYLNISLADKNKLFLKPLKYTENFLSHITDDLSVAKRVVLLAIERAKRVIENGEDVLLVVDDLNSIFGIDKDLVRNLVSIAKESKGGSITLLAVVPNEGMSLIEKLADTRLRIINNKIKKI